MKSESSTADGSNVHPLTHPHPPTLPRTPLVPRMTSPPLSLPDPYAAATIAILSPSRRSKTTATVMRIEKRWQQTSWIHLPHPLSPHAPMPATPNPLPPSMISIGPALHRPPRLRRR
uniref:Uncharacterized protein n=1 Tax=Aegilops tauschii subsp. strangulata TaxID=200361 RepID=A0A453L8Y7_AEGTS